MSKGILKFQDVTIRYAGRDRPAVDKVSLQVPKRSIVAIAGESGSGKSTLIRSVVRLLSADGKITEGHIVFDGMDLACGGVKMEQVRQLCGTRISLIFQDAGLYLDSRRTIGYQYVEAIRSHRKVSKKEAKAMAIAMLERMGLPSGEHMMRSYPFELSGGMKQRVGIAMAMTMEPELLLADEPTSALDVTIQAQVVRQMMRLRDEFGTSIIMVTHNMGVASYMSDYIAVMRQGRLVEWGTRDEIIESPKEDYTRLLLNTAPRLKW